MKYFVCPENMLEIRGKPVLKFDLELKMAYTSFLKICPEIL